jgi:EAL domain-containing protein (putative c-di-GMP-specific phosphodiesterase class I)
LQHGADLVQGYYFGTPSFPTAMGHADMRERIEMVASKYRQTMIAYVSAVKMQHRQ